MIEKKCFKCAVKKPLCEFYKHSQMADGHINKCKECAKKDVREHRSKNESVRRHDRQRWRQNENRRERVYLNAKKWAINHPKKRKAQHAVNNAVRDGRLVKANECECCGDSSRSIHGHHDDYDYPLGVRWLCPVCHQKWHAENGEGKNGF